MNEAHLIAGLGNPGAKYDHTRHNIGFRVLEELASVWGGTWSDEKKFKARMSRATVEGRTLHLCQPQTFMNLSGICVAKFKQFFKINEKNIFVIYDDIDLNFGDTKLKLGGGDAGHKGVRSISQHLGTKDFNRIRMGIGRPSTKEEVSSFVLSNFSKTESDSAKILIKNLCDDFEKIIQKNLV